MKQTNTQIQHIEALLEWLKSCPFKMTISSMQGGFVHAKFFVDYRDDEDDE